MFDDIFISYLGIEKNEIEKTVQKQFRNWLNSFLKK